MPFKGKNRDRKQKSNFVSRYISNSELNNVKPIVYCDRNEWLLQKVSDRMRGLGYRHWKQIESMMKEESYPKEFFSSIKISFFKFKLLRGLDPSQSADLIWIFKHCLTLKGQKLYKECYEMTLDCGFQEARLNLGRENDYDTVSRLCDIINNTNKDFLLPYSAFPLIFFEKSRMHLAFEPVPEYDPKEIKDIFMKYLFKLDVRELYVPPADILHKIGNTLYNDDGVVKKDNELHTKYDSGFKYQLFMAQPLQPREVWLPSKKIKNNNLFWMIVSRQIMKRDLRYPSTDIETLFEQIRKIGSFSRFDISGFGFQFVRQYLQIFVECIEELFPCTLMTEMSEEFYDILNNVTVLMPDGKKVTPPRGIGLGYYENLKTLVMLAFLDKYDPYSVYGDQGLLREENTIEAIFDIVGRGFILSDLDKVEMMVVDEHHPMKVKWAGTRFTSTEYRRYKEFSSKVLQALFVTEHWERKSNLYSLYKEFPGLYKKINKTIINFYQLYFGDEFYKDDTKSNFEDTGISCLTSYTVGLKKDYKIASLKVPFADTLFEMPYNTPYSRRSGKAYPKKIQKEFSRKRKLAFKHSPLIDSSIHYYVYPRVELNHQFKPPDRILPIWAEYLYAVNYGSTTGAITYNLQYEQMERAINTMSLHKDPLKAYVSGGYKVLDLYHRLPVATAEWQGTIEGLSLLKKRQLDYIQRADLPTNIAWQNDPMYINDDLLTYSHLKRKRDDEESDEEVPRSEPINQYRNKIKDLYREKASSGLITNQMELLTKLDLVDKTIEDDGYVFDDNEVVYEEDGYNVGIDLDDLPNLDDYNSDQE